MAKRNYRVKCRKAYGRITVTWSPLDPRWLGRYGSAGRYVIITFADSWKQQYFRNPYAKPLLKH